MFLKDVKFCDLETLFTILVCILHVEKLLGITSDPYVVAS